MAIFPRGGKRGQVLREEAIAGLYKEVWKAREFRKLKEAESVKQGEGCDSLSSPRLEPGATPGPSVDVLPDFQCTCV